MAVAVMAVALGAGCVSTHMKKFVGQDVRYVQVEDGAPIHVFDLPDGKRAFQFLWGGGTYVVPKTTTSQGNAQLIGDEAYYTERKIESGGVIVNNPGCTITYITKWDAERKGWIVAEISYPKKLVC
jgi:hypothetical protein